MKKKRIEIIPLGQNCMPRTILTRWKLKKTKIMGELSYPFDLAVFGIPEITKCLKTDFSEFFNNLEYKNNIWIKAPNCIYFYHDKRFKEKDKEKLINQYKKRISNFYQSIIEKENILFIQILNDTEEIEQQYKELKRIRKDKPFKFIIVDTQNIVKNISNSDIYVLKLPFPSEDYKNNWWKKEYYSSCDGKFFEKKIVDFCTEVINT